LPNVGLFSPEEMEKLHSLQAQYTRNIAGLSELGDKKELERLAMLLFYEQNNLTSVRKIFIEQFKFVVNTYF